MVVLLSVDIIYNIVCSVLFLQYNIMHSGKPSFVTTPPFLFNMEIVIM